MRKRGNHEWNVLHFNYLFIEKVKDSKGGTYFTSSKPPVVATLINVEGLAYVGLGALNDLSIVGLASSMTMGGREYTISWVMWKVL